VEDLIPALTKFHREIVVPDIERIVAASEQRLRHEMHTLLDAIVQELKELRTEYHMIVAGLKRVEDRLDQIDDRLGRVEVGVDKAALRSELHELQTRVDSLQGQVHALEARLEG